MPESLTLPAEPSLLLQGGFIVISVLMTAFVAWWCRRPWIPATFLLVTGGLALTGAFAHVSLPPPLLVIVVLSVSASSVWLYRGDWRVLPIRLLVGFQAFRILVELLIHEGVMEGVAPPQLTWTGRNWDMLVGLTALLLVPFAVKLPRWALLIWNTLGLGLLLNVVIVGILSLPLPIQQFHPDNGWLGFFPFHWLPLVLVHVAVLGHVGLYKRLREPLPSRGHPS